jgi:hypothetical protein
MKQVRFILSVLGLTLMAAAAFADVPKEATLLGQKYTLSVQPLTGKWKNGLSTSKPTDGSHMAGGITFVPGETPDKDRLFVSTAFNGGYADNADQLFMLTGADPNTGEFNAATSTVTQFFGGNVDQTRGGRVANVTYVSDAGVGDGKKQDINLILNTFTGDDYLRGYDLDAMTGDYIGDAIYNKAQRSINADEADPNSPFSGFIQGTPGPAGTLVFMGRGEGSGPQLSLFDPKQKAFLNILTNVGTATESQTTPYDINIDPWDIDQLSGNDYLLFGSAPADLNANPTQQVLYRATLAFPADLTKAAPEGIGVKVAAAEVLFDTDPNDGTTVTKDLLGSASDADSSSGISSIAVGRNGRLYFRTRDGRLITANPVTGTAPTAGN